MRLMLGRPLYGFLALALVLTLAVGACDNSSTAPGGNAQVSILLTDAPGDVAEAWVNISGIYVQGGQCFNQDNGSNGEFHGNVNGHMDGQEDDDCGRVWLREDPTGWIDLTTLSDDVEEIVDGATLPAGFYRQLRFVIEEAVIVTEGGSAFVTPGADLDGLNALRSDGLLVADGLLHCPSCNRSGLKVMCRDGIVALDDEETVLIADFDVTQSFGRERGHSNRWVMHPMIRCSSMPMVGGVAGTVSLADGVELPATCGNNDIDLRVFKPVAIDADLEEWTGHTSLDGWFKIQPLLPGNYDLSYVAGIDFQDGSVLTFSASVDPGSVTVEAGSSEDADYTIDDVMCSPGGGS